MFRLLFPFVLLIPCCFAEPKIETGTLNGAAFRIDIPEKWSGGLIMYCHGYNAQPGKFDTREPSAIMRAYLDAGYAVAQSGYAAGGWAIQEAVEDTEALRRHFSTKYGTPKQIFLSGHSMGGFLTMAMLEKFPNSYDGGLALCGPLAAPSYFMLRGAFDGRVVFDYYFPGALPSPVDIPADFQLSKDRDAQMEKLLDGKPREAGMVRQYAGLHNNSDLARTINFTTYVLKEVERRAGGNPFDNRDTVYSLTGDDNAVNDAVKRYTGDPRAAEYLRAYYTPTGRLAKPMLAIHTTYDPLVPAWIPNTYAGLARDARNPELFVQQYVKHDGHCAISAPETAAGLAELRAWVQEGKRPQPGLTPTR